MDKNGGNKSNWLMFAIGGLVGMGAGVGTGIYITKKKVIAQARRDLERIRDQIADNAFEDGYAHGYNDCNDFVQKNMIVVAGDNKEEILSNVGKALDEKKSDGEKKEEKTEEKPEEEYKAEDLSEDLKNQIEELFLDGLSVDDVARRIGVPVSVVKEVTKDTLPPNTIPSIDEINNYDLGIGEEEEVSEMREARERYLDEVDRYIEDPTQGPHYISQEAFNEESHLDQVYVNYYEGDNVFVETSDVSSEMEDPTTAFGTSDGKELFSHNPEREDEDIVCIRNFHLNAVYEITRFPQSFASIRDGSAFLNGETSASGGA